jgi:hypothetical protein
LKPVSGQVFAISVIVILVVGLGVGYLVRNQLVQSQLNQAAFQSLADQYQGTLDDSGSAFIHNLPFVAGFSDGQIAWYWFVGPTNNTINPVYIFQYSTGQAVQGQFPIIDVKPGGQGYTHFWEIMNVTVPSTYVPNTIKSLTTLNHAQQNGLVSISDSKRALNGPIIAHDAKAEVVNGEPLITSIWYRSKLSSMAIFETNLGGSRVPAIPIWLIQREPDNYPLLEWVAGKDLNGDGDLSDSNDLIGATPGQPGYSPLWLVQILHVKSTYLSAAAPNELPPFPGNPSTLSSKYGMFTSIQSAQADRSASSPTYVDTTVADKGLETTNTLVNCPALPLGVQPAGYPSSF